MATGAEHPNPPAPAYPHPLYALVLGALAGFFAGGAAASALAKQAFSSTEFPVWVHHLLAAGVGLAIGLAGVVALRGRTLRALCCVLPAALGFAGSWAVFLRCAEPSGLADGVPYAAAYAWPDERAWFGVSLALPGAAAGLLAGLSTRRLGGLAGGLVGALLGAWLAAEGFGALQRSGLPFGYVYPLAFAGAAGLVHFCIALAIRLLRADSLNA
ncbi:MAG: hypothetical protein HY291_03090 [Planctomycetes bacterium]|nr:hypothetical protein [Planctomycetota bacterium]